MTSENWYFVAAYLIGFLCGGVLSMLMVFRVVEQMLDDQHTRFVTAIQTLLGRGEAKRPAA